MRGMFPKQKVEVIATVRRRHTTKKNASFYQRIGSVFVHIRARFVYRPANQGHDAQNVVSVKSKQPHAREVC